MTRSALRRLAIRLRDTRDEPLLRCGGPLVEIAPNIASAAGLTSRAAIGDRVILQDASRMIGEVVRIGIDRVGISFFGPLKSVAPGAVVFLDGAPRLHPSTDWRGRTVDALGRPIDGFGPMSQGAPRALDGPPPPVLQRARVLKSVRTGVRAIDLFTPLALGQRIGIFAGSGVGKSTLLAMLARAAGFDTIVVALVGERGREVREFLEGPLADRHADTIAVVATADESPAMRRLAAKTAMTTAEACRDAGHAVLLVVDSVTRYAQAAREIGLAAGEPAVARGFPPSVFGELPRLLERAGPGTDGSGSITAVFTVLVDGDDHNDPIADAIRGTLDGHIVLDRAIADSGRYPAIDIPRSVSRLAHIAASPTTKALAAKLRAAIVRFEETRDLRAMGGYTPGVDPTLDAAVTLVPRLYTALMQDPDTPASDDAARDIARALDLTTVA